MQRHEARLKKVEGELKPGVPTPIVGWWGYGGYFYQTGGGVLAPEEVDALRRKRAEAAELYKIPLVIAIEQPSLEEMKEHWHRLGFEGERVEVLSKEYRELQAKSEEREKLRLRKRREQERTPSTTAENGDSKR